MYNLTFGCHNYLVNLELLSKMRFDALSRRIDSFCLSNARKTTCNRTVCIACMRRNHCTWPDARGVQKAPKLANLRFTLGSPFLLEALNFPTSCFSRLSSTWPLLIHESLDRRTPPILCFPRLTRPVAFCDALITLSLNPSFPS